MPLLSLYSNNSFYLSLKPLFGRSLLPSFAFTWFFVLLKAGMWNSEGSCLDISESRDLLGGSADLGLNGSRNTFASYVNITYANDSKWSWSGLTLIHSEFLHLVTGNPAQLIILAQLLKVLECVLSGAQNSVHEPTEHCSDHTEAVMPHCKLVSHFDYVMLWLHEAAPVIRPEINIPFPMFCIVFYLAIMYFFAQV